MTQNKGNVNCIIDGKEKLGMSSMGIKVEDLIIFDETNKQGIEDGTNK